MASSLSMPIQDRLINLLPFLQSEDRENILRMIEQHEQKRKAAQQRHEHNKAQIFKELTASLTDFAKDTKKTLFQFKETKSIKQEAVELENLEKQLAYVNKAA